MRKPDSTRTGDKNNYDTTNQTNAAGQHRSREICSVGADQERSKQGHGTERRTPERADEILGMRTMFKQSTISTDSTQKSVEVYDTGTPAAELYDRPAPHMTLKGIFSYVGIDMLPFGCENNEEY